MSIAIRSATPADREAIWAILEPVVRGGEEFAYPRDISADGALALWMPAEADVFVAELDGRIVGTSSIRPNQKGGGAHVANGGYATAPAARGRGIARALCAHSIDHARARGFRAMQYNFVVSTNERAVRLWQAMGFAIAGRLPGAFDHPVHGFVDALVMFRAL